MIKCHIENKTGERDKEWLRDCFYIHFIDEETEDNRSHVDCPMLHSEQVVNLNLDVSDSKAIPNH